MPKRLVLQVIPIHIFPLTFTYSLTSYTGLAEKIPTITWHELPGDGTQSFELRSFHESVETIHWNCEKFLGKPFFNELNFYYKKSKTFVCADTYWNYPTTSLPNYFGQGNVGRIHLCSKVSLPFHVIDDGTNVEANKVVYLLTHLFTYYSRTFIRSGMM